MRRRSGKTNHDELDSKSRFTDATPTKDNLNDKYENTTKRDLYGIRI